MLTPQEAAGCNTQGDGTIGLFMAGNTTGTTSGTADALSLSFRGAGAASVGISGGSVVVSVIQDGAGIQGAIGGNTAGVTALVQTGTWTLAGGNNVTLSQVANAVTISGANQTNQQVGLFAGSNTTQSTSATADARSLSFAGAGAVSVGVSGGSIKVSSPVQTNQAVGLFAVSNTTQSTSQTADARSLSFAGAGGASVGVSGGTVAVSVPVQTNQSVGLFALGNTTQSTNTTADARSLSFIGGGAVSVGMSGGSVAVSAPVQTNQQIGIFAVSNTTQSTSQTADARSLSFAGAGAASVGVSGGTVKVSVGAQTSDTIGLFAVSNTVLSTSQTADVRSLSFAGAGAASVGVSGGSVQVSVPVQLSMSQWPNFAASYAAGAASGVGFFSGSAGAGGASTNTTVSLFVQPVYLEAPLNFNEIRGLALCAFSNTTTANFGASGGQTFGLYSMSASTLSLMSSWSHAINITFTSGALTNTTAVSGTFGGSDTAGSFTYSSSATQLATAIPFNAGLTGLHMIPMLTGSSVRSIPSGQYWGAFGQTFATAGQALIKPFAGVGTYQLGAQPNDLGASSNNVIPALNPLQGIYSTVMQSNTVFPLSIATSGIVSSASVSSLVDQYCFISFLQRTT